MDWLSDNQWVAWLAAAIGLGVVEMLSLDLIFLMLALGAFTGMLAALLGAPFLLAALAAAAASVASLLLLRPNLVKRLHGGPELTLGTQKLLGRQGIVTEQLSGATSGRITLDGETWSARPYDDTLIIEPGETVEVLEIRGATAYVHPVPRLEP